MKGLARRHPRFVSARRVNNRLLFRLLRGVTPSELDRLDASMTSRAIDVVHDMTATFGPMSGVEIQAVMGRTNQRTKVAHLLTDHIRRSRRPLVRTVSGDGVTRFMPVRTSIPNIVSPRAKNGPRRGRPRASEHDLRLGQILVETSGLSIPKAAEQAGVSDTTLRNHLKSLRVA
jgi:hypothetical protein